LLAASTTIAIRTSPSTNCSTSRGSAFTAERVFLDFRYRAKAWGKNKRRVVGKAESTREGGNPRFVITNVEVQEVQAKPLYEVTYCGRGTMENRIKEQKLDLFAGRTGTASLRADQLRLWLSLLAHHLQR
jgi:hypothetical protein